MSLWEQMLGLILLVATLAGLSMLAWQKRVAQEEELIAEEIKAFARTVQLYALDHIVQLKKEASETTGPSFATDAGLPNALLPYQRLKQSGQNAWGQSYEVFFRTEVLPKKVKALIVIVAVKGGEGKKSVLEKTRLARKLGGKLNKEPGPGVSQELAGIVAEDGLSLGGQSFALASHGLNLESGQLCLVSYVLEAASLDVLSGREVLYRTEQVEHPKLNQMATSLEFNGQEVLGLGALELEAKSEPICDQDLLGKIVRKSEAGEERLLICTQKESGYGFLELAASAGQHLRGLSKVRGEDILAKPSCEGKAAILLLQDLSKNSQGLWAWAEEREESWLIKVKERIGEGWQESQGEVYALTYCQNAN